LPYSRGRRHRGDQTGRGLGGLGEPLTAGRARGRGSTAEGGGAARLQPLSRAGRKTYHGLCRHYGRAVRSRGCMGASMVVEVPYGRGRVRLSVPADRCRVVGPPRGGRLAEPLAAFRAALDAPIASAPLEDTAGGARVTVLLDDATRAEPHDDYARAVLERLVGARSVLGVVATGSHEVMSSGNLAIASRFSAAAAELGVVHDVMIHDCEEQDGFVCLGETSRHTPVELSRRAMDCDLLVIVSDVKNHYFAGYSNPVKAILPGVSSFRSIERNHALALDERSTFGRHPWHPDPGRRTNPVAEDMVEGAWTAAQGKGVFALAALTTAKGTLWAGAGSMQEAAAAAFAEVDTFASAKVSSTRCLVVSPGGHPQDETLYNAQRGLELSRNAVRGGGEILFVAECSRGTAPTEKARESFFDRLRSPLDEVIAGLEDGYVLYSHKAYKFAHLIRSLRAVHMMTELPGEQVEAAHMRTADDPQAIIDRWLADYDDEILIATCANKVALYS
jgi:nickel-dependent lactate racemase